MQTRWLGVSYWVWVVSMIGLSVIGSSRVSWAEDGPIPEEESTPPEVGPPPEYRPFEVDVPGMGMQDYNPFEGRAPEDLSPRERRVHAEQLADDARRSADSGDREAAVRRFERSYRMWPSPEVLLPLSRVLEVSGHHPAAAERLRRYINDMAEQLDEPTRIELEQEHGEISAHFSRISIDSTPQGALVLMGERRLGLTPVEPFFLEPGRYQLEARLEGHHDASEELNVSGGDPIDVTLTLEPLGSSNGGRRFVSLEVAHWSSVGLALAVTVATVIIAAITSGRVDEYNDEPWAIDSFDDVRRLRNATIGLGAASGTLGVTAISLGAALLALRGSAR